MCVDTPNRHKIAGLRKVKKNPEKERLKDNKDVPQKYWQDREI